MFSKKRERGIDRSEIKYVLLLLQLLDDYKVQKVNEKNKHIPSKTTGYITVKRLRN